MKRAYIIYSFLLTLFIIFNTVKIYSQIIDYISIYQEKKEVLDYLSRPDILKKLRDEFEEYSKDHPYKLFLPQDALPPLDLNKELMEKRREAM